MNVLPFSSTPPPDASSPSDEAGLGYRIYPLLPRPAAPALASDRHALLQERLDSGFYFEPDNLRVIARCLARDLTE